MVIAVIILLNLLNPPVATPLRIGSMLNFFIYFYLGFSMRMGRISIRPMGAKAFIGLLIAYTVGMYLEIYLGHMECTGLTMKIAVLIVSRMIHVVSALCIILGMYSIFNHRGIPDKLSHYPGLITLSGYCYGVYIFQQFILKVIYYKIPGIEVINPYWLPWLGFLVTLILSLLFTHYTLKTRVGRFLIG